MAQRNGPSFQDLLDEVEEPRVPGRPRWWRGPTRTTGVLSKHELDAMANADCRFLDEEPA